MRILLYLISIVAANVITAALAPIDFKLFLVPAGTFLIGATFILRDFVQTRHGKKNTYLIILSALGLSALTSYLLGDSLMIVCASLAAFALSESTDTEIFSRMQKTFTTRVLISGVIGGFIDSVVFVVIGLSPLGAGFLAWEMVPMAIVGQVIVKSSMQLVGASVIKQVKGGE